MAPVSQPQPAPAPSPQLPWYKRLSSRLSQSDAILAAIVGAIGVVVGALVTAGVTLATSNDKADSGEAGSEPRISISSPADEGSIPEVQGLITVTGQVSDLGPGQTVWVFDRAVDANDLYTHDGPCPVDEEGGWTCPSFELSTDLDGTGGEHRLYVAIVDDSDQRELIAYHGYRARGINQAIQGRTEPPGLAHDYVVVKEAD